MQNISSFSVSDNKLEICFLSYRVNWIMNYKKMIALCLYQLFMADSIYKQKEELESEEHACHKKGHIV